ncbi:MAG: alpha/beta hydrolase [Candidatus Binatia bacterium]
MRLRTQLWAGLTLLIAHSAALAAENSLVKIAPRPGVSLLFYYVKQEGASASVVLLTGGAGGIGLRDGVPTSDNFLIRSRDHFAGHKFNVAVVGRPSDMQDLDYPSRISAEHVEDLRQVASYLKKDTALPVWLVGTSRGSVSATAAAIAFGNQELAGVVLTASVTNTSKAGAVPQQRLDAIRIPVLVLHHQYDACWVCRPREVPRIISGLKNAPVKKLVMVDGGGDPRGDPCEPLHWHGFIGMEKEAVGIIGNWIKNPGP